MMGLAKAVPDPTAFLVIDEADQLKMDNRRLLNRLLTQIERSIEINALQQVTKTVVEAARETLVIGRASSGLNPCTQLSGNAVYRPESPARIIHPAGDGYRRG
jgi:hypothetical protein